MSEKTSFYDKVELSETIGCILIAVAFNFLQLLLTNEHYIVYSQAMMLLFTVLAHAFLVENSLPVLYNEIKQEPTNRGGNDL